MLQHGDYLVRPLGREVVEQREGAEYQGDCQAVAVALPPVSCGGDERQNGDGQQDPDERDDRPHARRVCVRLVPVAMIAVQRAVYQKGQGDHPTADSCPTQRAELG